MKKLLMPLLILIITTGARDLAADDKIYFSIQSLRDFKTIALVINSENGVILEASHGARQYYEYPDLIGMNISHINTLPEHELKREMQKAKSENRNFFNFKHRLSNGEIRNVEVTSYPMSYNNRTVLVSRVRDVTREVRTARLLKYMYILLFAGIVMAAVVSNLFLVRIRRQKRITESLLKEKETILREVHHRIKNNISTISGLLSLQSQSSRSPEVQSALKDTISRVRSIGVLYENLMIKDEYRDMPVRNYVESLVASIVALYPELATITIEKSISDFTLIPKKLFPLGIIINELLTNIMKYAFTGREKGRITIALEKSDSHITLAVSDDGNGMPEGFSIDTASGFGLTLVRMLADQLKGTLSIRSDKGTSIVMKFDV